MKKHTLLHVALITCFLVVAACGQTVPTEPTKKQNVPLDTYGGTPAIKGEKTGFFHLQKLGKRWIWITPDGNGFIPLGVSMVARQPVNWNGADRHAKGHVDHCLKKYGSLEAWRKANAKRFRDWGFNFTGYYTYDRLSSENIPYVITLKLTTGSLDPRWEVAGNVWYNARLNFQMPDVFNPDVLKYAEKEAKKQIEDPNDPLLLFYYPDEPDQLKGFAGEHPHLGQAILCSSMEIGAAVIEKKGDKLYPNHSKQALIETLRKRYGAIGKLNLAWGTDFKGFDDLEAVRKDNAKWGDPKDPRRKGFPAYRKDLDEMKALFAEQYCKVVKTALRKTDPNHVLAFHTYGAKLNEPIAQGLLRAGGFDLYMSEGDGAVYEKLGRPLMRVLYLHANADSPLRLQGDIEDWVVTADAEGTKPDPKGSYLKFYDDDADIWFKLKFVAWRLPVKIDGLVIARAGVDHPGEGQALYSGKDENGRSWFTVRSANPYATGKIPEWANALDALKAAGKKATYLRSSAVPTSNYRTQELRGAEWARNVGEVVGNVSPSGDYYIVGLEQWKWTDNGWTYWLEQNNFGLVTLRDNAYDGKEATKPGADGALGTWDDELRNYGDFITPASKANRGIYQKILSKGDLQ